MLRRRPKALLAFALSAAASLALYTALLDWRDFFLYWEVPAVVAGGLVVVVNPPDIPMQLTPDQADVSGVRLLDAADKARRSQSPERHRV